MAPSSASCLIAVGAFAAAAWGSLAAAGGEPSRYATLEAERAVTAACASPAPFVILDTFAFLKPVNIDDEFDERNEDGAARIGHGDVVAAIVSVAHPAIAPYQIDPVFNVRTLVRDFRRLADDIEAGRIPKPAAVVSSIVLPVSLREVNARATMRSVPASEIFFRRDELRALVTGDGAPGNPYAEIDRQIGRLRAGGVPVFVAAGNTGPDDLFNVLALSDGVYAVGALDREGRKAGYTSAPDLVSVWSDGYVVLTETAEGVSVSAGRRVELPGATLPEEREAVEDFAGRKARELVLDVPSEIASLPRGAPVYLRSRYMHAVMQPGLYRTEDLLAAYGYPRESGNFIRALEQGPYMHFPSDTIFAVDVDGALRFDPLGDGTPGQVKLQDATSFAAPNVCAAEAGQGGARLAAAARE
ncbi:hypothetical protein [Hansschlegelia beijingensis]|uniref:Peptidase S8/S53 domain-containing protein n=1 Tax=Hansschlegelia beijingensis TaxID=1133344 RepID=A0A7W6CYV4_9HYPH|nr:hypothetical protein [Hansschlegelia beijingensis]MBB3973585.1 hypothetical protein [Hansschlegelia beijingensis]